MGRVKTLRFLGNLLDVFRDQDWIRYRDARDIIREKIPELSSVSERTIMRYLNRFVKMGYLEKMKTSGKTMYHLSSKGAMSNLASVIHASLRVQSNAYPDLKKGSVVLKIENKETEGIWGLLILLQEDMRARFGELWKDTEWGKSVCRALLHLISESLQPGEAFVWKVSGTDLFFFKPPHELHERMSLAVQSGKFSSEEDMIIQAINGCVQEKD
jgi:DNA-binding PadR family transcriptional regulator